MTRKRVTIIAVAGAVLAVTAAVRTQQPPDQPPGGDRPDPVAALKQSLQEGQAKIRQYEWIETTIVSMKGEEKSRKQNRCYYGADGTVQKVPVDKEPEPPAQAASATGPRGRRGGRVKEKIVENKKEEIQDYMARAVKLIHGYVPPKPAQIQAAKEAGRLTVTPQAGGAVRLAITQYLLPGDSLTLDLDTAGGRLVGLGVTSYLDEPDEPVTLAVQMATLSDGATYAAQTTLDVTAKNIRVVVQNSGHRPVTQ